MNHTLPAITLALALASTANAQGVRFGRMHLKQRAGQMVQQGMKRNGTPATVPMARLGSAMTSRTPSTMTLMLRDIMMKAV